MALATQCPHCYTTFRVANDQLKLHAGLVRCGACQQTFNGVEHLLAPGAKPAAPAVAPPSAVSETPVISPLVAPVTQAPVAATESAAHPEPGVTPPAAFSAIQVPIPDISSAAETDVVMPFGIEENDHFQHRAETTHLDLSQIDSIRASASNALDFDLGDGDLTSQDAETKVDVTPQAKENEDEQLGLLTQVTLINRGSDDTSALDADDEDTGSRLEPFLKDIPDTEVISDDDIAITEEEARAAELAWNAMVDVNPADEERNESADETMAEASTDADAGEEKPTFVIQAEKKQRRSRVVRILMIIASALLFLTLLAQSTYSLRNELAAWFPQTKPALQDACKLLKCRIELLTQIETISIEANELQALSTDKNIFSLSIQLQNKSSTLQAWPMLELILNDAKEKPVLKRVFTPADYLTNKNDLVKGFAPGSEQTIKLYFELSGAKAAGYHVGVFYP